MVSIAAKDFAKLIESVGTHKKIRPFSPLEVSRYVKLLLEDDNGDYKSVSNRIQLSEDMIRSFVRLAEIPKSSQTLIGWGNDRGKLDFTTASIILSRLQDNDKRDALIKIAVMEQLKKEEVTSILQYMKLGLDLVESVEKVKKYRPIIEKGYVVVADIGSDELRYLKDIAGKNSIGEPEQLRIILGNYLDQNGLNKIVMKKGYVILTMSEGIYSEFENLANTLSPSKPSLILNSIITKYKL